MLFFRNSNWKWTMKQGERTAISVNLGWIYDWQETFWKEYPAGAERHRWNVQPSGHWRYQVSHVLIDFSWIKSLGNKSIGRLKNSPSKCIVQTSFWINVRLSFIRPSVRSLVRAFVRESVRPFVCSFVHSFIRSFVLFIHSFIRLFTNSFVRSQVCSYVKRSICSFIRSFFR